MIEQPTRLLCGMMSDTVSAIANLDKALQALANFTAPSTEQIWLLNDRIMRAIRHLEARRLAALARTARDKKLTIEQRLVVLAYSKQKARSKGIAKNARVQNCESL